ncbi:hypothetical protein Q8W30_05400 [Neptunomonas phycophila]|uniref:Uncharacterized protein n=1 Tax=Neptunomonas phycophila TaxID=1572645 RepID=A0ABT9ETA4_9GAMM|nr:hypothetical protein [Neptunomonas phycophila]MDP2522002.1 hypothetical protein [Neptunomonas phycophila]
MNKAEFILGLLTRKEKEALRRDVAESSVWARTELKRRREEKAKQNSEHGTNNGTTTEPTPKQP